MNTPQTEARSTLTVSQAAKRLGVSVRTLHNWDLSGKLVARRHPLNGYRLYDVAAVNSLALSLGQRAASDADSSSAASRGAFLPHRSDIPCGPRLNEALEILSLAQRAANAGIWDWRITHGLSIFVSPEYRDLVGLLPDEPVTYARLLDLVHEDDRVKISKYEQEFFSSGREYVAEFRIRHRLRGVRWLRNIGNLERDKEGRPVRFTGISIDLTEQKRAEERANCSESRLGLAIQISGLGYHDYDVDADRSYWSPELYRIAGMPEGTPMTMGDTLEVIHPADRERIRAAIQAALDPSNESRHFAEEFRICRVDNGETRWVHNLCKTTFADRGGKRVPIHNTGIMIDVTQRKEAERRLRDSENFARRVSDVAPSILYVYDLVEKRNIWGNREMMEVLGYTPIHIAELGNRLLEELMHPDDWQSYRLYFSKLRSLGDSESAEFEFRLRHARGSWIWLRSRDMVFRRDEDGSVRQIIGAALDITTRKRAEEELQLHRHQLEHLVHERTSELEASSERLRLNERMAAIGTLSAGLGHDMGNLLMPIRVRLDSLESLDLPQSARNEISAIRTSMEYLRKLAGGLRTLALDPKFSSPGDSTELQAWWEEMEPLYRNSLPQGVTLEHDLPQQRVEIAIGKAALTQVVFNLVQNAGDALRGHEPGIVRVSAAEEGEYLKLRIADNGPGMSEEVRRRCMEPFYTTKPRGISTGLGLALVYGIVQEAGGRVDLQSAPGAGTSFTVLLPRSKEQRAHPGRRALVHLDDARIRAYVVHELARRNYQLVSRPEQLTPHDVVVTEEVLPGAAGRVLQVPRSSSMGEVRHALQQFIEEGALT